MNVTISQIDHTSKYISDVIALGDVNKGTLGLFPKDAYKESASKKQIIVAIDENTGRLIGYLLYNVSRRKMLVSIVHLCIETTWRGKGVAKLLFNELRRLTQEGYFGVRVRCRIDFHANKLWPKLGFVAMGEMDGRGKKGTRLTIWKFEYEHPSLFSYLMEQNESEKIKVVIDANVLYQLQEPNCPKNEESLPLLEPWLDIDLYVTPEIYNEIARSKDPHKKEASRKFADSFNKVDAKSSEEKFEQTLEKLRPVFPDTLSLSDESDLRQLTYAIVADIPFFITRDGPMLDRADDVFDKFGIQVLMPSDLVLMQDELLRGDAYAPSRLAGSQIRAERVHSQQSGKLTEKFFSSQGETKGAFNKKLQLALSNASTVETIIVLDAYGDEHGLVSYSRQYDGQIIIPIFRVGKAPICQYVAKYLINNIALTASAENRTTIKINDEYLPKDVIATIQECGFFQIRDGWAKIALQQNLDVNKTILRLTDSIWPEYVKEPVSNIVSILQSSPSHPILLEVEKSLWPLKIVDIPIPAFIVPIRPIWAMHLFDVDTAGQDLFGGDPSLILNAENVYYRKRFPKVLSAPGRVLWYVSSGGKRYQGSMHIKACSYLDDLEIGKPKQLFSKYKKLGIYKWKDVYNEIASGDLEKEIMVFKFSKTEIFKKPIHLSQLQAMWKADGKNFNNAISPLSIDQDRFFRLYNLGMKEQ